MDVFNKLSAIFFSLLILGQAAVVRKLVGTWIFPACIFSMFWFLFTFIPLVGLFPVPVEPLSVGYILLVCLAFSISALGFNWREAFACNRRRAVRPDYGSRLMRAAFYGTTLLTLFCLLINTLMQGISLYDVLFNLLETSSNYISRRYNDDLNVNLFGQFSVILTYTAAILGGLYYGGRHQSSRGALIILMAMIPSILVMVIQGAKGTLFLAITLFWAGILIVKISADDLVLIRKKNVLQILIYTALMFPALVLSFLARGLYDSDDFGYIKQALAKNFYSYSSAHLYGFSDWFSHLIWGESVVKYTDDFGAHGFHTFMSIFKLLGSQKYVPPGFYDEYFYYGDILQTNIYTMFRGLIYDFGFFGGLFFVMLLGGVLHLSFWWLLVGRRPVIAASVFAHSLGFFYTSFIISMFVWNSTYASFGLLILILYFNNRITEKPVSIEALAR